MKCVCGHSKTSHSNTEPYICLDVNDNDIFDVHFCECEGFEAVKYVGYEK